MHLSYGVSRLRARVHLKTLSSLLAGGEADELNEGIESEASAARRVMTTVTRNIHPVSPPSYSSNSNTSLPHRNGDSGWNNLERIRIPTFSGNKTEFQHWNATFTSCVDASAVSAQFKMLRG